MDDGPVHVSVPLRRIVRVWNERFGWIASVETAGDVGMGSRSTEQVSTNIREHDTHVVGITSPLIDRASNDVEDFPR